MFSIKQLSFGLLCLILTQSVVMQVFWEVKTRQLHHENWKPLINGDETKLFLTYEEYQSIKINEHEIKINEIMYDVKRISYDSDKLILTLKQDNEEQDLLDQIASYFSEKKGNSKNGVPQLSVLFSLNFIQNNILFYSNNYGLVTQLSYGHPCYYQAPSFSLNSPPPKGRISKIAIL